MPSCIWCGDEIVASDFDKAKPRLKEGEFKVCSVDCQNRSKKYFFGYARWIKILRYVLIPFFFLAVLATSILFVTGKIPIENGDLLSGVFVLITGGVFILVPAMSEKPRRGKSIKEQIRLRVLGGMFLLIIGGLFILR